GREDLTGFRRLLRVFAEAFDDIPTFTERPPGDSYLRRLLGRESFIALVAEAGDEVLGGLAAYELYKYEQERSEIYLYDLAVAAQRRRGIATALIHRLRDIAADRGAWVVFVQADPPDAPAVALYEGLGRREDVYHYDIPVPQRQPVESDRPAPPLPGESAGS